MKFLENALALSRRGFFIFPIIPDAKSPLIDDWKNRASRDENQIRAWWTCPVTGMERAYNIGISTEKFGDVNQALIVVDVDEKVKEDGTRKNGRDSLLLLELEGKELPRTLSQDTPSGGEHLLFVTSRARKQGTDVLGPGLDVRSRGGYILGAGSTFQGRPYSLRDYRLCDAPLWLEAELDEREGRDTEAPSAAPKIVDRNYARERARFYLEQEAKPALEGAGGDQQTFATAARVKDLGCEEYDCLELMLEFWNPRCVPPWHPDDLARKVANAYEYGNDEIGSSSPEADFDILPPEPAPAGEVNPLEELNREFAFVMAGGGHHILHETKNVDGQFFLDHITEASFHKKFASKTMIHGGKSHPVTQVWMKSPIRRSYSGLCFKPGLDVGAEWYNLWRGYSVKPAEDSKHEAVDAFLEHAEKNVCQGNQELFRWLIGYFAQLVQKPYEKPLCCLVFRGAKGTGKNALIDRIAALISSHAFSTADRRYLTGNFNSHLENCLMLTLNEAFWSGDKSADGILKALVTEPYHLIERKGKEPYQIQNLTRVIIIGNEDWLVPATEDERRYAVFDVTPGRQGDWKFFETMRKQMEDGAYSHLLRYLLDYDISDLNFRMAPSTDALLEQKELGLKPLPEFWYLCLQEGRIPGIGNGEWEQDVSKNDFRDAFYTYCRGRGVTGWLPNAVHITRQLKKLCRGIEPFLARNGEDFVHKYKFPDLASARSQWETFIGHKVFSS